MPTKKKPAETPAKRQPRKQTKRALGKAGSSAKAKSPRKKPPARPGVEPLKPPKLPKRPPSKPSARRPGQRGPDKSPRKPRKPPAAPSGPPEASTPAPAVPDLKPFVADSPGVPLLVPPDRPVGAPADSVVDVQRSLGEAQQVYTGKFSTIEQRAAAFSRAMAVSIGAFCRTRYNEPLLVEEKDELAAAWEPVAQYYDDALWSKPWVPALLVTGTIVLPKRAKYLEHRKALRAKRKP